MKLNDLGEKISVDRKQYELNLDPEEGSRFLLRTLGYALRT
jgi:hypothetical protein